MLLTPEDYAAEEASTVPPPPLNVLTRRRRNSRGFLSGIVLRC
jgi:hypothetical protein